MKAFLISLLLLCSSQVSAEKIYRWTDAGGNVHFGSHSPYPDAQQVELEGKQDQDTLLEERRAKQKRLLDSYNYERNAKKQDKQKQQAEQERRAAICNRYIKYWKDLNYGGPVYFEQGQGKKFLDEAERQSEKIQVKKYWKKNCKGSLS